MILKTSIRTLLIGIAAFFVAQHLPGIEIDEFQTLGIVTLLIAIVNGILAPVTSWLSFPFTVVTIALIIFTINTLVIKLADNFIDGFTVHGWPVAMLFSLAITGVSIGSDQLFPRRSLNQY